MAQRDQFVSGQSVRPSGSHTFLVVTLFLVTQSYVSQATHAFLGMLPLLINAAFSEKKTNPPQKTRKRLHVGAIVNYIKIDMYNMNMPLLMRK